MRDVQNLFDRLRREIGSESLEGLGRLLTTIDATPGMHPAIRSGILQLAAERLRALARGAQQQHEGTSVKRIINGAQPRATDG